MRKNLADLVLFFTMLLLCASSCTAAAADLSSPVFIAHAGGAYEGRTYTNSLEALNHNYWKGHRIFEVDFTWTADDNLVAIHDWGNESDTFRSLFFVPEGMGIPTKSQFLRLKSRQGLTQLSLEDVLSWAKSKGDAFIVTDVKSENLRALEKIRALGKEYLEITIPQVYSYAEYGDAKMIGYPNVILTLYRMKVYPDELLRFVRSSSPFAVTMPWRVAQSGLASRLQREHVVVYAHTVNDFNLFTSLRRIGVFGIYTDGINPP